LFDMSGSVWEVCQSRFPPPDVSGGTIISDDSSLLNSPGEQGVIRGGSFGNAPRSLRSGCRMPYSPQFGNEYVGFRVVRTLQMQ
ncbi:MAG: SUMF1/EgtB/PvdO family nonheme iron enzyme, partial [Aureliella sp.]